MMKLLLALLLAGISSLTSAQSTATFMIRSGSPLDPWLRKMVGHVVHEHAPLAMLSFDAQLMKIRTNGTATPPEVVAALNGAGIGTFELVNDTQKQAALPIATTSGDPVQDRINYREAKRAWIAAHPEEYREMISDAPQPVKSDRVTSPE